MGEIRIVGPGKPRGYPYPVCKKEHGLCACTERDRGRQKKRWEDNIKEWTGMDFASSTRVAENRSRWKGIVANSSVVPRRPAKVIG